MRQPPIWDRLWYFWQEAWIGRVGLFLSINPRLWFGARFAKSWLARSFAFGPFMVIVHRTTSGQGQPTGGKT